MDKPRVFLAYLGLVFNVAGGAGALLGVYLIAFLGHTELAEIGRADGVGYLFVCVGLCIVAAGVVLARYAKHM
ncbi:MAG: hypothetical protein RBR02_06780 [Desulfuromonadaceae bacterium]|nr:hypothetical protein [Desulfuromonadaceae bacterium]